MAPVFNKITVIEEKKLTPEYEGYLKDISATGFIEAEGVTYVHAVSAATVAGGLLEGQSSGNVITSSNKVLFGDKHGQVQLLDVSRKLILDKTRDLFGSTSEEAPEQPRFIQHIETATIEWSDSKLTYAAVIARCSPVIKFLLFKHSENKLFHLYSLNVAKDIDLANPETPYSSLPAECKISSDCMFLTVTSFGGEI